MRTILSALIALIATAALDSAVAQTYYPWCAQYYGRGGGARNCGFVTYYQCQATVSGVGGYCVRNPAYAHSAPTDRKKYRKHR